VTGLSAQEEVGQVASPAIEEPVEVQPALTPTVEPGPIGAEDPQAILSQAQTAMNDGQLTNAIAGYARLIESGELTNETIHDLRDASYRYPIDVGIWQTLGDAYIRMNHLQDALDAYTKAEELLR